MTRKDLAAVVRAYHADAAKMSELEKLNKERKQVIVDAIAEMGSELPTNAKGGFDVGGFSVKVTTVAASRLDTKKAKTLLLQAGYDEKDFTTNSSTIRLTVN